MQRWIDVRTGTAWVQVEDAVAGLDAGLVGVAVDHDGDAGGFRLDVQVVQGVDHVEKLAVELHGFRGGESGAGAGVVDVAADCGHGRELAEGVEEGGVAQVTGVEDVVDATQGVESFGAEEAVGVGEDAYAHALRSF